MSGENNEWRNEWRSNSGNNGGSEILWQNGEDVMCKILIIINNGEYENGDGRNQQAAICEGMKYEDVIINMIICEIMAE